jgi:hypothetical protein
MTTLLDKLRSVADKDTVDPLQNGFVVITENELERFAKLMQREVLLEAAGQMRLMKHGDSLSPHLWLLSMAKELE